jgi:hypothetical protein
MRGGSPIAGFSRAQFEGQRSFRGHVWSETPRTELTASIQPIPKQSIKQPRKPPSAYKPMMQDDAKNR